jgi:hypothetical protein
LDPRSSSALTTDFGHPSRQFRRPADQYLGLVETVAGALQRTTFTGLIYDAGLQPSVVFANLSLARCARLVWIGSGPILRNANHYCPVKDLA